MNDLPRNHRSGKAGGQAMVEYILLIGLIVIFLIVLLFQFRNSVIGFTGELVEWFERMSAPPPPPPPPSFPPPQTSTPSPTPTPRTVDDWAWLEGEWCGPYWKWTATRSGPAQILMGRTYPTGARSSGTGQLSTIGPNIFRMQSTSNPNDWSEFERRSDGTFIVLRSSDGPLPRLYRRC